MSSADQQPPEPTSYEAASARIEEIVRRLDSGEAGLRETLELVAEGRRLVEWCAGELEAVGRGPGGAAARGARRAARARRRREPATLGCSRAMRHAGRPARRPAARRRVLRARAARAGRLERLPPPDDGDPPARRRRGGRRRGRRLRRRGPGPAAGRGRVPRPGRRDDARRPSASASTRSTCSRSSRCAARSRASTAAGRSTRRRSTSRCARRASRCTRSLGRDAAAGDVRQLAAAARARTASPTSRRCSRCSSAIRRCASSSTRRRPGTTTLIAALVATGAVDSVDFKGHYKGTIVDNPADPVLYRRVAEALPGRLAGGPRPERGRHRRGAARRTATASRGTRRSTRSPTSRRCRSRRRWSTSSPRASAACERLCAGYDYCAEHGIGAYGGGQFELGPGRGQAQYLASLFHPDTPNDLAPGGYNETDPPDGLPPSPLRRARRRPAFAGRLAGEPCRASAAPAPRRRRGRRSSPGSTCACARDPLARLLGWPACARCRRRAACCCRAPARSTRSGCASRSTRWLDGDGRVVRVDGRSRRGGAQLPRGAGRGGAAVAPSIRSVRLTDESTQGAFVEERLGIAGSGAIACGLAATAAQHGDVLLWARSDARRSARAARSRSGAAS